MENFEIRNIFSTERLRTLGSDSQSSARRATSVSSKTSKDSLKKSMNELLSEIVSSLTPDSSNSSSDSECVEHKVLH